MLNNFNGDTQGKCQKEKAKKQMKTVLLNRITCLNASELIEVKKKDNVSF